jgi:hypothetical protein
MVAYFVRRLVGGIFTLFLVSFVLYSATMPVLLDIARWGLGGSGCRSLLCYREWLVRVVKADRPWPLNYLAWMFDPTDYSTQQTYDPRTVTPGIDLTIGSIQIKGSGLLTGDFGESWLIERGTPVLDVFGPGLGELLLGMSTAILLLMAVAFGQRLRRPPPYALPVWTLRNGARDRTANLKARLPGQHTPSSL